MKSFLEEVNIYEAEQEDGRILRSLKFRFPVFFNDQELYELDWDNESTVETVVLLERKADDYVEVELELNELDLTSAESKATYKEIQEHDCMKVLLGTTNYQNRTITTRIQSEAFYYRWTVNINLKENNRRNATP